MAVLKPQRPGDALVANPNVVELAGSMDQLIYPPLCPCCGNAAAVRIPIQKLFIWSQHNVPGQMARVDTAAPLFCASCAARHRSESVGVTFWDRLYSLIAHDNIVLAAGSGVLAFVLGEDKRVINDPLGMWPLTAIIVVSILISTACVRSAWRSNAHKRIPLPTSVTSCFDFGFDEQSYFKTTPRIYAIKDSGYAHAFRELNEQRSAALLGPKQRMAEARRAYVFGFILLIFGIILYTCKFK